MVEHRCIKAQKASLKRSPSKTFNNEVKDRVTLEYSQSKSSSLITSTCPECQLSLGIKKYHEQVPSHYHPNCRISKRITSFDEQYLSHCLELIQITAAKAVNFSVTWSPTKTISSAESNFLFPRNVSEFSLKRRIIGSGTRSKSMILRSPLFKHGTSNNDNNSEDFSFPSVRRSLDSYGDATLSGFSMCSSPLVEFESGNRTHESDDVTPNDRSPYPSSMLSTSSDRSTCTWPVISHGLLRCTQRNGITHFVFSTDHKREVYMTRSSKSALTNGSSLDWTYFIHLSTSNRKGNNVSKLESNLVGRINVSTQYKFSADGSKLKETEFVLYGNDECPEGELDKATMSCDTKKGRRLPGKVSNLFKPLHLAKHRSNTRMWGTSTWLDLSPLMPEEDEEIDSDQVSRPNLLESDIPSNFELAAIIVKEHVELVQQEMEVGGWGLNFLKKATEKQTTDSRLGTEYSNQESKSTVEPRMDVLLPTGCHGGPKPSSLIQRWRNAGQCDCAGWDAGCPLSLLTTRLDVERVHKSLDLYVMGDESSTRAPSMKIVNIQAGLYSIEYLPRLSALQCFSVAVAVIHSRNPTLRPNTQTN